ncbi:MAG: toll/interleukin-1 receptor domain-containing protein [Chloroflexota bacterium]
MTKSIYLSYSHKDEIFVSRLRSDLKHLGAEIIEDGLENASVMLLVVTANAMADENVTADWQTFNIVHGRPVLAYIFRLTHLPAELADATKIKHFKNTYGLAFEVLRSELARHGIELASQTIEEMRAIKPKKTKLNLFKRLLNR